MRAVWLGTVGSTQPVGLPVTRHRFALVAAALALGLLLSACDAGLGPNSISTILTGDLRLAGNETALLPIELEVSVRGIGDDVEIVVRASTDPAGNVGTALYDINRNPLPRTDWGMLASETLTCDGADRPICTGPPLLELTSTTSAEWKGQWRVRATVAGQAVAVKLPGWVTIKARVADD